MKKILSIIISMATLLCLSAPAMAEGISNNVGKNMGYVDYELDDLISGPDIALNTSRASAKMDATAGTVEGRLFDYETGTAVGKSANFKFTGIPDGAKITNIQAWNPSKSNISQGKFTAVENIQVLHDGMASEYFKFWVISEPSSQRPCNTAAFNGLNANATYAIQIQGYVANNESGMDGFTVRGTKVRVSYTY